MVASSENDTLDSLSVSIENHVHLQRLTAKGGTLIIPYLPKSVMNTRRQAEAIAVMIVLKNDPPTNSSAKIT